MANLSKTRTLFAFTSPRTIEKTIPEIKVLIESFSRKVWNTGSQIDFFKKLFQSVFYEGNRMPDNVSLAARDRITRAPKALGFVDLKPAIALTDVGKQLLSGKRTNEVIARQLFKFQLPSPYHKISRDRLFNVKPYLELLRLVKELGNISKMEIAIFFLQLTHYKKFDRIVNAIKKFRNEARKHKGNRKAFIDARFTKEILKIYTTEIRDNDLKTRQSDDDSLKKFIKTKKSNLIDYADAYIRYLRATQLVTVDKKNFRIVVAPSRIDEVNFILKNVAREPLHFRKEADFKKYLFSPVSLILLTDNREYLKRRLYTLSVRFDQKANIDTLKDLVEKAEEKIISSTIQRTEIVLRSYKEFSDVMDLLDRILRKEMPDPSLYLEWNAWRAVVMLNYAKHVKGNFSIDLDGVPLNTAQGKLPDIEIEYDGFKLILEVTLSTGNKQYEMEGEPVARHFGNIQRMSIEPVYCLFIAPKISEGALAHFFNLNKLNTKAYGGKTRIVPISINQFVKMLTVARVNKFNKSKTLKSFLDSIIERNFSVKDEWVWYKYISQSVSSWV